MKRRSHYLAALAMRLAGREQGVTSKDLAREGSVLLRQAQKVLRRLSDEGLLEARRDVAQAVGSEPFNFFAVVDEERGE